jgi:membrane glycosyltransferase
LAQLHLFLPVLLNIALAYCDYVLNQLREAEILISHEATLAVMLKKIGVSDCTYYRWRREDGSMRVEQA